MERKTIFLRILDEFASFYYQNEDLKETWQVEVYSKCDDHNRTGLTPGISQPIVFFTISPIETPKR